MIHEGKTKYIEMRGEVIEENKYIILKAGKEAYKIENVNQFEYLRVTITNKCQEGSEIYKRLSKGSHAVRLLMTMLRAKNVSRAAKDPAYKTIIRPVVLYVCGTWTMSE